MTTLSHRRPKAIKNHTCSYCCTAIDKGEVYNVSTHIYEGSIYDWKSHLKCTELAQKLNMFDYCDEVLTQEDFWENVEGRYYDIVGEKDTSPKTTFAEKLDFVLKHEGI